MWYLTYCVHPFYNFFIKYGLTPSQVVPKLQTHNLECIPMHVSKWPKMPNLVLGPKPGGDSIFTQCLVHSRLRRTYHEETTHCRCLHP